MACREPVRRIRRAAIGCVALVLCGAAARRLLPAPVSPMVRLCNLSLGTAITGWACGTDRRGGHLAVATADGRIHVITLTAGDLEAQSVECAAELGVEQPAVLWYEQRGGEDELCLLALSQAKAYGYFSGQADAGRHRGRWLGRPGPGLLLAVRTSAARAAKSHVPLEQARQRWPWTQVPSAAALDGWPCAIRGVSRRRGMCVVSGRPDGTRQQWLLGRPVAVGDVNGTGSDAILTVECESWDAEEVVYRLYAAEPSHLKCVWTQQMRRGSAGGYGGWADHLVALDDLDGDGRCDLAVGDNATGRLTVWTWAPDARGVDLCGTDCHRRQQRRSAAPPRPPA